MSLQPELHAATRTVVDILEMMGVAR